MNTLCMSSCLFDTCLLRAQVVRQYYGGREIGPEDLTAALSAGMGPREHRRLSKKKRLFENPNYLSKEMQVEVQECNTVADNVSEELSTCQEWWSGV
jgi:hypothetical protein